MCHFIACQEFISKHVNEAQQSGVGIKTTHVSAKKRDTRERKQNFAGMLFNVLNETSNIKHKYIVCCCEKQIDDNSHVNDNNRRPMEHRSTLTVSSGSSSSTVLKIWELPEILLYHIAQFVSPPTKRASFFFQKIAPLCKAAYQSILTDEEKCVELWDLVLKGDYGRGKNNRHDDDDDDDGRRSSKRLKRSPAHIVKEAHKLMIVHTEIAYGAVWELSYSTKKNAMTKQKLVKILNEYGPRLMINRTMGTGGNFIVEICRCRNTSPNNILLCVKELVRRGASVNIPTEESVSSSLTALCVASVRGMPKVVKYLLSNENGSHSSSIHIKCSGRFRLHTNPKKTVRCIDTIPLEFCKKMWNAEKEAGATTQDLKDLNHCIKLLLKEE
jgi:hypothetical protein